MVRSEDASCRVRLSYVGLCLGVKVRRVGLRPESPCLGPIYDIYIYIYIGSLTISSLSLSLSLSIYIYIYMHVYLYMHMHHIIIYIIYPCRKISLIGPTLNVPFRAVVGLES